MAELELSFDWCKNNNKDVSGERKLGSSKILYYLVLEVGDLTETHRAKKL